MSDLKGLSAIITGASRGIGEATARYFAEGGVNLVLVARNHERLAALAGEIQRPGQRVEIVAGDVADYDVLERAVAGASNMGRPVDVLVNNAGVIDPIARIADSQPDTWAQAIDVNVKGVYFGVRAVLPGMAEARAGTIINISSGAATGALEGWSHYCASKAAVLSLTRCVHKEYAEQGVRVIGLSPGTVATDMQVEIRDSGVNPVSQLPSSAHIPPEWVAKAIAFLCGPGGDSYRGHDFSLKNDEGRAAVGLPPISGNGS